MHSPLLTRIRPIRLQRYAMGGLDHALSAAPNIDAASASKTPMLIVGGARDRVVPALWIRSTALRDGVRPDFVDGGHLLMTGRTLK